MKITLTITAFLFGLIALKAQTALENTWVPNYRVNHVSLGDGKVFMSGDFDWFGTPYEPGIAIFDNQLAHDNSYSFADNIGARSSVSDGAGGWYTSMYGNITHIKADKTIEDLPLLFEGGGYPINALERVGNILYVGGNFTTVNGAATRKYVAAIDLSTKTLTSWNPNPNGYVYALKAAGSVVYVGGSYTSIGGQTRSKIAAIDATTGLATSWNALVTTGTGYVYTIDVGPSTVYFGGSFSNVASGSPTRRNFAAVNTTTGALTTFNPRPDDNVRTILLDGTTLYVAGEFTNIAGVNKTGLVALNVTTGLLTSFSTTFNSGLYDNNFVYTLAIDGQKLFIGGDFLTINGTERARLAVVDKTTGALEPMVDRAMGGYVLTISISGGKLLAAGNLRGISGITSSLRCIALDEETGQGTNWIPQMPALPANAYANGIYFHYQNNRVYYWQDLQLPVGNDREARLGAVNSTDGAAIATWSVTVDDEISAWAFSGNALYLTGNFTSVNGVARNGFAAVDLVTGAVLPWTISFTPDFIGGDVINSMIVHNNVVYVGGEFSFTDNGVVRNNLAAWNATTGAINSWAPQVTLVQYQYVKVGAAHNGQVYLIGDVALRADATSGEIDDWQLQIDIDYGVESIVIQGSSVYLAGGFSPGLVRVDINTGEVNGWQPELNDVYDSEGSVNALAVSGTKLFVGGNFSYGRGYYFGIYVLPVPINNEPPQILATTTAVPIEGLVTIDLVPLISDADDNLDLSSLQLLNEFSEQGALATINESFELILDYGGVAFTGTDVVNISVCDFLAECAEQALTVEVSGDVLVYNAVSPNGDGTNDSFVIKYIDIIPETQSNTVTIFNRWGDSVFEISNYNNIDRVFIGQNNNGKDLPSGTYFYKIEFSGGRESKTGFLSLKR